MLSKLKKELPSNNWQCANKNQKKTGDEGKIPFSGKPAQRKVNTYTRKERILETEERNNELELIDKHVDTIKQNLEEALQQLNKNNEDISQLLQDQDKKSKAFKTFVASWRRLTMKVDVKKEIKELEQRHQNLLAEIEDHSNQLRWQKSFLKNEEDHPVADHQHILYLKQLLQDLFKKEDELNNIADDMEASIAKRKKLLLTKKQPRNSKAKKDFCKHFYALMVSGYSKEKQQALVTMFQKQRETQNGLFTLQKQLEMESSKKEKVMIEQKVNLKKKIDELLVNIQIMSAKKDELIAKHEKEIESMKKEQENQQLKAAEKFSQEKSQLETKTNVRWLLKFIKVYADKVKYQEIADKNAKFLKKENKQYKSEVDALKIQLKESQNKLQKSLEVQNHLVDCNDENARLNKRMSRQDKEFTRKEVEYTEKIQRLEKDLESQKHDVKRLDDELTAKALECYGMQAQLNKARNANNANQKKSKLLNERVRKKSKELEIMKEKAEKDANEKEQLIQKLKSLEEKLSGNDKEVAESYTTKDLKLKTPATIIVSRKSQMKSRISERPRNATTVPDKSVASGLSRKDKQSVLKEKVKVSKLSTAIKGNIVNDQRVSTLADSKKPSVRVGVTFVIPKIQITFVDENNVEYDVKRGTKELRRKFKKPMLKEHKTQNASDFSKTILNQQSSNVEGGQQYLKSVLKEPGEYKNGSDILSKEIPRQSSNTKGEIQSAKEPEESQNTSDVLSKEIPKQSLNTEGEKQHAKEPEKAQNVSDVLSKEIPKQSLNSEGEKQHAKEPEKAQNVSDVLSKEIPKQSLNTEDEKQSLKSVLKEPEESKNASEILSKEILNQQDSNIKKPFLKNSVSKDPEESENASSIYFEREVPKQQTLKYFELNLIRNRLADIKSNLLTSNEDLRLAIIEKIEELTDGCEEYARELNIHFNNVKPQQLDENSDDDLMKTEEEKSSATQAPNAIDDTVSTPVWKRKKKKKQYSKKGKAKKSFPKHQNPSKNASNQQYENKELAPKQIISVNQTTEFQESNRIEPQKNLAIEVPIQNKKNLVAKEFSLDELKGVFNVEHGLEEFLQELKKRYGILKTFDSLKICIKTSTITTADDMNVDENCTSEDCTIAGSFEALEKCLISSYESLAMSQSKLIDISKSVLHLNVVNNISEYRQQELTELICDTKKELSLRIEQLRELHFFVQEHTKKLVEIEIEERNCAKNVIKNIIEKLQNLAAKKLKLKTEIKNIKSDQQLLREIIQKLVKRMREYESEFQQLQQLNAVEIEVKRIVSILHKDFDDKLEAYKQAEENMRVFYSNVSEVNHTLQQLVEQVTSDANALQPTPNSSLVTSSNDVSVVPADDFEPVGSDANDVKSCKVDGDKISDELTL